MMSNELKPCPCCGSENIDVKYIGNSHTKTRKVEIKCKKCRLTRVDGAVYHNHDWCYEVAKNFWNSRASDQLVSERDELKTALRSLVSNSENNTGNEPSLSCMYRSIEEAKALLAKLEEKK